MIIPHANKYRWIKNIHPEVFPDFGKNASSKIKQLEKLAPTSEIRYEITPLQMEQLQWFVPLYENRIASKHNPDPFNVTETTLLKPGHSYPYFILTLLENNVPIGGTIFSLRENYLSCAYRTYPSVWQKLQVRCSPALYAEYVLTKYALAGGSKTIVHGKDRNPYGIHSNIGVAIFKLAVGCRPEPQLDFETCLFDTDTTLSDTLVFELPEPGKISTHFFLICAETSKSRYEQLFAYPDFHVTWLPLPTKLR